MKFRYTGYDNTAKKISGDIDAGSEGEVRNKLRDQRIRAVTVYQEGAKVIKIGNRSINLTNLFQSAAPDVMEFTAFIRQFAVMQGSGIPIVQALEILGNQAENENFGRVLLDVKKQIEEGKNLTDALKRYNKVFDRIFLNLIAAGELSGSLDKILNRLAIYYEKAASLRRKVKAALTYPVVIVVLVTVVVIIMLTFVVPTFADMFAQGGKPLPAATQVIVNLSTWVKTWWWAIAAVIGSVAYFIYFCFTTEATRRKIDPVLLKMPLFGDLILKIAVARFTRTLGTMIQSGVSILEALEITGRIAGNYVIEDAIAKTRQSITEGNTVSAPLIKAGVFPKMVTSMISIGEQTGALDAMCTKIAEFYEDEVDAKVGALTSILEPLMIVFVGVVVAGILIPMYLPIFQLGEAIGGG